MITVAMSVLHKIYQFVRDFSSLSALILAQLTVSSRICQQGRKISSVLIDISIISLKTDGNLTNC